MSASTAAGRRTTGENVVTSDVVFLLDVDNTLLDNDRIVVDLRRRHYPAHHYVMVDDKLRILAAMKEVLHERLTTVFPRQGHYALDPVEVAKRPAADVSVEHIGDLADIDVARVGAAPSLVPTKVGHEFRSSSSMTGGITSSSAECRVDAVRKTFRERPYCF
jgi:hypothetical protein